MNSGMWLIPGLLVRTVVVIAGILFVICAPLKLAEELGMITYSWTFLEWLDALLGGVNYVFIGYTFFDCLIGWIKAVDRSMMQVRMLGISIWSAIATFFAPMLAATAVAVIVFIFADAWWTGVAMYLGGVVAGFVALFALGGIGVRNR